MAGGGAGTVDVAAATVLVTDCAAAVVWDTADWTWAVASPTWMSAACVAGPSAS